MKLKVKETSYTVKPKQTEGKLVVGYDKFILNLKPRGVRIYKTRLSSLLNHDRQYGVKIKKQKNITILKQMD